MGNKKKEQQVCKDISMFAGSSGSSGQSKLKQSPGFSLLPTADPPQPSAQNAQDRQSLLGAQEALGRDSFRSTSSTINSDQQNKKPPKSKRHFNFLGSLFRTSQKRRVLSVEADETAENGDDVFLGDSASGLAQQKPKKKSSGSKKRSLFGSRLSVHSVFTSAAPRSHAADNNRSHSTNDLSLVARPASEVSESSLEELECPLCFARLPGFSFPRLTNCAHRSCQACLFQYLQMEILESRVAITCPACVEMMHPSDIYAILVGETHLLAKWEEFSVRRVLMNDPDSRWCPAPDCSFALIAHGCAPCPMLRCERPGCETLFCYHCKQEWHANQTCDEARARRGPSPIRIEGGGSGSVRPGDIKACPRCQTYIVKMQDGSCNHMVCALCGAEFCWLCLKEISDLHYLSPSGCTFWGKKPWSRKKKLLWQLGTLIGAPVGIALIAGLAVPAIVFGVPVWLGRRVHQRMRNATRARHHFAVAGTVIASVLLGPALAALAVGVGVPILLAYVYGVVPFSLCRNGSCGMSASASGLKLDPDEDILAMTGLFDSQSTRDRQATGGVTVPLLSALRHSGGASGATSGGAGADATSQDDKQDASSTVAGLSIHSGSTTHHRLQVQAEIFPYKHRRGSVESGLTILGSERINFEEASVKALAGSTYCDDKSIHTIGSANEYADGEGASLTALAGSMRGADGDGHSVRRSTAVSCASSKHHLAAALSSGESSSLHDGARDGGAPTFVVCAECHKKTSFGGKAPPPLRAASLRGDGEEIGQKKKSSPEILSDDLSSSVLKRSPSLSFVWDTLAALQEVRRLRAASSSSMAAAAEQQSMMRRTRTLIEEDRDEDLEAMTVPAVVRRMRFSEVFLTPRREATIAESPLKKLNPKAVKSGSKMARRSYSSLTNAVDAECSKTLTTRTTGYHEDEEESKSERVPLSCSMSKLTG